MSKKEKKKFLSIAYAGGPHLTPPVFKQQAEWQESRLDLGTPLDLAEARLDKLKAIGSATLDAVSFQQNMQKIHLSEALDILKEFRRILKIEGFIHLTVPDLQRVVDYVKKDMLDEEIYSSPLGSVYALDVIYGHRASVKANGLNGVHLNGFTPSSIGRMARDAGFYNIRVRREPAQLICAAHRPKEGFSTVNEKIRVIDPNMKAGIVDDIDVDPVYWKSPNLKKNNQAS